VKLDAILTGQESDLRSEIEARAAARGVAVESVDSLDEAAIERAACVILAEPGDVLPADAPVVLAAGRILLLPQLSRSFGLENGLDHLEFADADEAITLVESYRRAPDSFARVSVWARVKARALSS
jgi:hypothetical protein